ncbi:MAG: NOL1/NOP2/sun family putative RNA methylase [Candidatus Micrarchaeia archaeon]
MDEKSFRDWLGSYTDADKCLSAFRSQKEFFRVNTLKISVDDFLARTRLRCERSPYYGAAFESGERKGFQMGKTWEYFLGLIYPQTLPSILVSLVLAPDGKDTVLDVAASPGSKFSHMAMLMQNKGVLVGNDIKGEKISALYSTINRMNILNSIVTMRDGSKLDWRSRFSKVLLDAPCTALGSGMGASERWEPENSRRISNLQTRMLFSAFDALRPGGTMVYSTCTYAREENEGAVSNLLQNVPTAKLEDIALDIPHDSGLPDYGDEFRKCWRIYPHHLQSEGFFIAKIRKGD